jgi:glycogen operon protein
MHVEDWQNPDNRTLIADLYRPEFLGGEASGSRALVVLHAGWSGFTLTLPETRAGFAWRRVIDSAEPEAESVVATGSLRVEARAALLLVEELSSAASRHPVSMGSLALAQGDPVGRLATLAEAAGLAPDWWDIAGTNHRVPDDTRRALLRAMGIAADSPADIAQSLHDLANARNFVALPPSLVVREGQGVTVTLGPALAALPRAIALRLRRPDGSEQRFVVPPDAEGCGQITAVDGRVGRVRRVTLPPQPVGRYRLVAEDMAEHGETRLIVAPARCFLPLELAAGGRRFGLAAHLYSLTRAGDQGIGDFTTLTDIGRQTAAAGGAVVGLNPLHALFPENRSLVSPYSPSDRRFLEPLYIDVTRLPHLVDLPEVRAALAAEAGVFTALHAVRAVDYAAVWAAKARVLQAAMSALAKLPGSHPASVAFAAYRSKAGRSLDRFATFQAISAGHPDASWHAWPDALRDPSSQAVEEFAAAHAEDVTFFAALQWLADHQLAEADAASRGAGLSLGFYRDLAVGTAPVGAEAWSEQDFLMNGVSVGAPPDPFSIEGQNWSLPPPNPWAMRAQGYEGFGELLRANMRHAGALRIDHVLGLNRLFLIPEGGKPADGAYLAYPLRDMLGVTALESIAARCMVVGEDLGTVPDGVREAMAESGLLAYRVFWFEREGQGFRAPAAYPKLAAACVSTHDLPTLAGWWEGADIAERRQLGFADDEATERALGHRDEEKRIALAALAAQGLLADADAIDRVAPLPTAVAAAFHAYVGETPCILDLVQADDLGGETVALNLPGTDMERANWRRKVVQDAADLWQTPLGATVRACLIDRASKIS